MKFKRCVNLTFCQCVCKVDTRPEYRYYRVCSDIYVSVRVQISRLRESRRDWRRFKLTQIFWRPVYREMPNWRHEFIARAKKTFVKYTFASTVDKSGLASTRLLLLPWQPMVSIAFSNEVCSSSITSCLPTQSIYLCSILSKLQKYSTIKWKEIKVKLHCISVAEYCRLSFSHRYFYTL